MKKLLFISLILLFAPYFCFAISDITINDFSITTNNQTIYSLGTSEFLVVSASAFCSTAGNIKIFDNWDIPCNGVYHPPSALFTGDILAKATDAPDTATIIFSGYYLGAGGGTGGTPIFGRLTLPADIASSTLASVGTLITDYGVVLYLVLAFLLVKPAIGLITWLFGKIPFNRDK
jgi:hypothetical protein